MYKLSAEAQQFNAGPSNYSSPCVKEKENRWAKRMAYIWKENQKLEWLYSSLGRPELLSFNSNSFKA